MSKFKLAICYIWGDIQFSLVMSILIFGSLNFIIDISSPETSLVLSTSVFIALFVMLVVILATCGLLYFSFRTVWDDVHVSKVAGKKGIIVLLPDLYNIVSFIIGLGCFRRI